MKKTLGDITKVIPVLELEKWDDFVLNLHEDHFESNQYIFRGQEEPDWFLQPQIRRNNYFDRHFSEENLKEHMKKFTIAIKGRRGTNPEKLNPIQYMALGQHFGLATPLLDFTKSPYVAAFFAFYKEVKNSHRAIYALRRNLNFDEIQIQGVYYDEIGIIEDYIDENHRLINQSGVFVHCGKYNSIEDYVIEEFEKGTSVILYIYKYIIPSTERKKVLLALRDMNITPLTLFPDLEGAAMYANLKYQIPEY